MLLIVLAALPASGCREIIAPDDIDSNANPSTPLMNDDDTDDPSRRDTSPPSDAAETDTINAVPGDTNPVNTDSPVHAPRNVVFFIGDGMGLNHITAASFYEYGVAGAVYFQNFDVQGMMATCSANDPVTDSAAAATALATGHKVDNHVVGLAIPGDGSPLPNLTEFFKSLGKATGLVTTAAITHATPAGFGAHAVHRNNTADIAANYLQVTRPNVLFGGGAGGMTVEDALEAGYTVVETLMSFNADDFHENALLSGQFGTDHIPYEFDGVTPPLPHLWEMSDAAIDVLLKDPDGFFVMVEGARIDHASHANSFERMVPEVMGFERTVREAVTRRDLMDDTLFIVTADHSTGGLVLDGNNGAGILPDAHFTTTVHTGDDVPIYVQGAGAEQFEAFITDQNGRIDNTDIYHVLTERYAW